MNIHPSHAVLFQDRQLMPGFGSKTLPTYALAYVAVLMSGVSLCSVQSSAWLF